MVQLSKLSNRELRGQPSVRSSSYSQGVTTLETHNENVPQPVHELAPLFHPSVDRQHRVESHRYVPIDSCLAASPAFAPTRQCLSKPTWPDCLANRMADRQSVSLRRSDQISRGGPGADVELLSAPECHCQF